MAAKLTPLEEEAWDTLRAKIGGGGRILPRDTDALRLVIEEACKNEGIPWPGGGPAVPPREYPIHEPPQLQVTEAAPGPAPGDRIVELDEALATRKPRGKSAR